ncbi:MAG: ankyrin repeat domain-containing protein [Thermodesulfobacteriota bacterium]
MNNKIKILAYLVVLSLFLAPAMAWGGNRYGGTAKALDQSLFFALARGDLGMMAALRDKGADMNATLLKADLDPEQTFGLMAADLLKTDADVDNWPILTWAVYLQNKDAVRVLLRSGAQVNAVDTVGTTALHWACWTGNYPIVSMLLASNANAHVVDQSGRTPLDWATLTGQEDIIRLLPPDVGVLDSDGDGVPDPGDQCPKTPKGAHVDDRGCWVAAYANFFDTNKAVIKPAYLPHIQQTAKVLLDNPHISVVIVGHTDSRGSDAYNLDLGQRRADAVRDKLVEFGVPSDRLMTKSFGEREPIADNTSSAGMAKNRRVEIRIWEPTMAGQ